MKSSKYFCLDSKCNNIEQRKVRRENSPFSSTKLQYPLKYLASAPHFAFLIESFPQAINIKQLSHASLICVNMEYLV